MIEKLFRKHWKDNKGLIALVLGFLLPAIALFVSLILFRSSSSHLIGISTIFFSVMLTLPFLNIVLSEEEKIERKKQGSFFHKNESIIDFYLYFMLGAFVFFLLLSFIQPRYVFSLDDMNDRDSFLDLEKEQVQIRGPSKPLMPSDNVLLKQIVKNNLYVVLITFILSLLFGAGSIYIIVLNVSLAASAIVGFLGISSAGDVGLMLCNVGVFSFHFVPEMLGFLIAAIAGGILYVDFRHEKLFSKNFDEVSLESILLLLLGVLFICAAALIEVFISGKMLQSAYCSINSSFMLTVLVLILILLVLLEHHRPRKKYQVKLFHDKNKKK